MSIFQRSPIHPSTPRLFQIKLLRNAVNNYQFPNDLAAKHQVIQRWIETDRNGTLAKISEVQLHGEFLGDIFLAVNNSLMAKQIEKGSKDDSNDH